ncbi:MAG: HEAT repeat domain-containing protein [Pyrinomonadaceae bacterium]
MRRLTALISMLFALALFNAACANTRGATQPIDGSVTEQQTQSAKNQTQSFINVEGTDLNSKLDAALKRARSASAQTPFWSAYSFDVRPGVAVDPNVREFHGYMSDLSGSTSIFIGTSNGMTVETRNLGIFLLRDPSSGAVTRLEIYNLDRRREFGGYPVYYMDRANNEESLNFLRSFVESAGASQTRQQSRIAEHATLALGLHDDARVSNLLKNFVRSSSADKKIRATAIFWLGQIGGETAFLADIVRNDSENKELRSHAAEAIGNSRDKIALTTLQSLYETVSNREVKRSVIHAVSENENKDAAFAFLLKVAKSDPDSEARSHAVHWLGESDSEAVVDELMKIYASDPEQDVRRQVLHALSEMQNPRAQARLLEVARSGDNAEMRRQAIHWLGEKGTDAIINELMKIYDADGNSDVKRQILHAFSEMENQRAEDKLFAVARSDANRELRKQAIHWIGERAGQRSLELLRDTVNSSNADTEVQMQAVHAISERPAEEAVPLLIKIARTHPNADIRRQAMHWLGESGDPRAVEFFKEVLAK